MLPVSVPLVCVTGFGPFEEVGSNPSSEVARRLAAQPPSGLWVVSGVLPVSFARAPGELDRLLDEQGEKPALLLALGVHCDPGFRLERRARARLTTADRPDVDGVSAVDAAPPAAPDLATSLDLDRVLAGLVARGVEDAFLSEEAGGYVCERTYHRALEHGGALSVPALFVHTPKAEFASLERQVEVCRWIIELSLG